MLLLLSSDSIASTRPSAASFPLVFPLFLSPVVLILSAAAALGRLFRLACLPSLLVPATAHTLARARLPLSHMYHMVAYRPDTLER